MLVGVVRWKYMNLGIRTFKVGKGQVLTLTIVYLKYRKFWSKAQPDGRTSDVARFNCAMCELLLSVRSRYGRLSCCQTLLWCLGQVRSRNACFARQFKLPQFGRAPHLMLSEMCENPSGLGAHVCGELHL